MSKKTHKTSPLQRIVRVIEYLIRRGANKESVNLVYRNIIKNRKLQKENKIKEV